MFGGLAHTTKKIIIAIIAVILCIGGAAAILIYDHVCEVYEDGLILTRYSEEGVHQLGSAGCANPDRDDSGLISEQYYSKETDSPHSIEK